MALCYKMSKITSPVQREEVQGSSPPINMYVLYIWSVQCHMHLLYNFGRTSSTSGAQYCIYCI